MVARVWRDSVCERLLDLVAFKYPGSGVAGLLVGVLPACCAEPDKAGDEQSAKRMSNDDH